MIKISSCLECSGITDSPIWFINLSAICTLSFFGGLQLFVISWLGLQYVFDGDLGLGKVPLLDGGAQMLSLILRICEDNCIVGVCECLEAC